MRDIIDVVERVKMRLGLHSDAALSRHLGFGDSAVRHWRKGTTLPSASALIDMYQILSDDATLGLLDLQIKKSTGTEREIYTTLKELYVKNRENLTKKKTAA